MVQRIAGVDKKTERRTLILIIVSALGYFVDVYDMMLFTVVRKKSLLELGVLDADTLSIGLRLLNLQNGFQESTIILMKEK